MPKYCRIIFTILIFCYLVVYGYAKDLKIGKIEFIGTKAFSQKKLKKNLRKNRIENYSEKYLLADIELILDFYRSNGYLQASVTKKVAELDPNGKQVNYKIYLDEGKQTKIDHIAFSGCEKLSLTKMKSLLQLKSGDPLNLVALSYQRQIFIDEYANNGYAYTTIRDSLSYSTDKWLVDLFFLINEGKQVTIKSIKISGQETLFKKVISRELESKPGDIFSLKTIQEDQQRLYATGLFRDVRINMDELKTNATEVNIDIKVKEEKLQWIGGGIGYGNLDGVRLTTGYGHQSIFRTAQKFKIESTFSKTDLINKKFPARLTRKVDAEYIDPRIFSTRWTSGINTYYEYQHNLITETTGHKLEILGLKFALGRTITKHNQLSLQTGIRSDTYFQVLVDPLDDTNTQESVHEGRSVTNTYSVSASRDTRNDIFNTTGGYFIYLTTQLGGFVFQSENSFIKYMIDVSGHKQIKFIILSLRINSGLVNSHRQSNFVEVTDQFTYGGSTTNRGFKERMLGPVNHRNTHSGNALIASNAEVRISLLKYFQVVLFSDYGRLWYTDRELSRAQDEFVLRNDPESTKPLLSLGTVLRYFTPVGPLRFDLGFAMNKGLKKSQGVLHISFGQAF